MKALPPEEHRAPGSVKCVVWDLDNTIWDGVLLEDGVVRIRPEAIDVIRRLDDRGIVHSVASRNDPELATSELERHGLLQYMLVPQIDWGPKSSSIRRVAAALNLGLDALAFVDDEPFERAEVAFALPEVFCIPAADIAHMPGFAALSPRFVTADSRRRRQMYRSSIKRDIAERNCSSSPEEFLAACKMVVSIDPVKREDLLRAEELTVRTHQMNTTGIHYSFEELDQLRVDPSYMVLVAELEDRYGGYGKVGLAVLHVGMSDLTLKLLLASCRVISRGIGGIMLTHVIRLAHAAGVPLLAEMIGNDRNRAMEIMYRFAGFREYSREGDRRIFIHDAKEAAPFPSHVMVRVG